MTVDAARLVAEVLARRLGLATENGQATDAGSPIGAALALALLEQQQGGVDAPPDAAAIVRSVAAMAGACPACLGQLDTCGACHGEGRPGYAAPDPDALVRWITPPLARMGLCVGRPRARTVNDTQPGGTTT